MNAAIDEDLHRSLGQMLENLGFTVFDIRDHNLRGEPDEVIFDFAQSRKALLFSADLGFANTMEFPVGTHSGIVILRFPNEMSTTMINEIVSALLGKIPKELLAGSLVVITPGGLRIRHK